MSEEKERAPDLSPMLAGIGFAMYLLEERKDDPFEWVKAKYPQAALGDILRAWRSFAEIGAVLSPGETHYPRILDSFTAQ